MYRRENSSIYLYIFLSAAFLALIFVGVYEPGRMMARPLFLQRKKALTVSFADSPRYKRYRFVVPVKTKADTQSKLNRNTRFISKKESAFSGKTTDKKRFKWTKADTTPADRAGKKNRIKKKRLNKKGTDSQIKNPNATRKALFPVDRSSIFQFNDKYMDKRGSIYQELPGRIGKTDLLVNFDSRGQISLGTLAYRYSDYFYNMVNKISKQWRIYFPVFQHYYGLLKEGEVLVRFELDIDGKVKWVKLEKSYGQHSLDNACLSAIREARDFGPLPGEFRKKGKMVVPFLFVYHRPKRTYKMFH